MMDHIIGGKKESELIDSRYDTKKSVEKYEVKVWKRCWWQDILTKNAVNNSEVYRAIIKQRRFVTNTSLT